MKGRLVPVAVGAILLAALTYFCFDVHGGPIERDLASRALAALSDGGVKRVTVTAVGRGLTLSGAVSSEEARERAKAIARQTFGVRAVSDSLTVEAPAPTPSGATPRPTPTPNTPNTNTPRTPTAVTPGLSDRDVKIVATRATDGWVTLSGVAPNATARVAWSNLAKTLYGMDKVRVTMRAADLETAGPLVKVVLKALPELGKLRDGRIAATTQWMKISGTTTDHHLAARLADTLSATAGRGYRIDVAIETRVADEEANPP